ncbi:uncharacterized protein LOC108136391 [Drosophila elegans]|uniref:uncharacterized protein LOC108136391 n=1 Tax=Drosophila elegans TaxID=30023 RepID=UPI0007E71CED|nr:uncharacterized protein LOC108136391 [Drosophila elegans]
MKKPQKDTKVKRGKRHAHTHTLPKAQGQNLAAAEVENARKAVERKLIYLSESNRANAPIRPGKRGTGGAAVGGAGGVGSTDHGVHRRKHAKKPPPQVPPKPPKPPKVQEETSSQEKADTYEKRTRGGYNVYLQSPRRNGLTPRDYEAEAAQMAALLAAHRTSSGTTTKPGQQLKDEGKESAQELGNYVQHHHHQLPSYSCRICGAMFHIRSLLGAHRYTHDHDFEARFRGRRQRGSGTAGSLCKFCDRKFDLERTLHIHQLSNCKQIPPQQHRKLAFTELAHEKKAPLPSFQRCTQHSRHSDHSNHSNHSQRSHRRKLGNRNTTNVKAKQQRLHKTILQASAVHERWR